jgi:two-component system, cell cycle sensor histidine kinase and response regulator CckA
MSDARANDAIIAGYEAILAGAVALDVVRDADGRITDFVVLTINPAAERLMGRPAAEVVGRSVREAPMLVAGRKTPVSDYAAVMASGVPIADEFHLAREGGGSTEWVHRFIAPTRAGLIIVLRRVGDDSIMRPPGEDFFEATDDLWCILTREREFIRVSASFERILGWREADLVGTNSLALVHPADLPTVSSEDARHRQGMPTRNLELRMRHADGTYRRVIWSAVSLRGSNYRYAVGRDVTEQRRLEDESQKRGALLHAVLAGTADVAFVKDRHGRYLLMIGTDVVHGGLPASEIVGRTDADIAPDYAEYRRRSDLKVMETGQPETYEFSFVTREEGQSGARRTMVVTKAPYRDGAGQVIGVVGVARDVTDVRRLEERVQQAQKMEAVGRLAGGIAHDFNNLLTAILSFATLAAETLPRDHPARADLAAIRRAGEGAAELTRQMLAFGRREVNVPRPLAVNEVVGTVDRLLRSLVGESARLEIALDPTLAVIDADPSQIERVLVNLVVNAGHATPDGGTVWVETANAVVTPADAGRVPGLRPGSYVRLTVRDTGIGMDDATRARAFEPFFTTKPIGQGTGLGLSSVYGIVQELGGAVFVDSEVGRGSTFAVYLPVAPGVPAAAVAGARGTGKSVMPRGHERVMLVEDNQVVRQAEERILVEAGYEVYPAPNGVAALCLVAALDTPIDLVITDLMMPEMGGRAVVGRLREDWPNLRALLVSGYEAADEADSATLPPATGFLQKPFTADALLQAVRALLDTGRVVSTR